MLGLFHKHLKIIPHYIFLFFFSLDNPNADYFMRQWPFMADNHELYNKWNLSLFKFVYNNNHII